MGQEIIWILIGNNSFDKISSLGKGIIWVGGIIQTKQQGFQKLSAFIYRLCHEDFSSIIWSEQLQSKLRISFKKYSMFMHIFFPCWVFLSGCLCQSHPLSLWVILLRTWEGDACLHNNRSRDCAGIMCTANDCMLCLFVLMSFKPVLHVQYSLANIPCRLTSFSICGTQHLAMLEILTLQGQSGIFGKLWSRMSWML